MFSSVIGLVSPIMLEQLANGGTYFFFAGFAVLAFFTTCKLPFLMSRKKILINFSHFPVFFIPETKGRVSIHPYVTTLLDLTFVNHRLSRRWMLRSAITPQIKSVNAWRRSVASSVCRSMSFWRGHDHFINRRKNYLSLAIVKAC